MNPVHFRCPHCGSDIAFHDNDLDASIAELTHDVMEISSQLAVDKSNRDHRASEWRNRAVAALEIKKRQLNDMKIRRASLNKAIKKTELEAFAQVVRESVPEEQYAEWHRAAEELIRYGKDYEAAYQRTGVQIIE